MSKVAELAYDVQELYIEGIGAKQIASELECPVEIVLQVLQEFGVEDSDTDYPEDEIYSPYYGA
jgi:orotate phosphoribosyltransferase-like protein